jgi:hypothetical protein
MHKILLEQNFMHFLIKHTGKSVNTIKGLF